MGRVKEKIEKTDGASLALALLLFLMCAMAGSVILTAASVSAGRMAKMSEQDSKTYTLTSTADVIGDEISGKTYNYNAAGTGTISSASHNEFSPALLKLADKISDQWKAKNVDNTGDPGPVSTSFDIEVKDGAAAKTVTAVVTMDIEYNLKITLSQGEGSSVEMTIPAAPYVDTKDAAEASTSRFPAKKVTWLDPKIKIEVPETSTEG